MRWPAAAAFTTELPLGTTQLALGVPPLSLLIAAFLSALAAELLASSGLLLFEGLPLFDHGLDFFAQHLRVLDFDSRRPTGDVCSVLSVPKMHKEVVKAFVWPGEVKLASTVEAADSWKVATSRGRLDGRLAGLGVGITVTHDGFELVVGVLLLQVS
jgi:hypothetical protein